MIKSEVNKMTKAKGNITKLNNETAKLYIRNYNNLVLFFGEKRVQKMARKFNEISFATTEYVVRGEGQDRYFANKGYPVVCDRTSWTFKEYRGEWSRDVQKTARSYRIPSNYQSKEGELILACLVDMFPQLKGLEISAYHADSETAEIYIKCENGKSLYCPLMAFTKSDYNIIYDRHKKYHEWYYGGTGREEYLKAELETLETATAQMLKELLK
jgi:hypothetical protein